MNRTIAIGDIHGCAEALVALIRVLAPTARDTLVLLGDYVDRGPDTRGVLDQILALQQRCQLVLLLGNHEQMMLGVRDGVMPAFFWERYGGYETLQSYGGDLSGVTAAHWDLLGQCRRVFETNTHAFMHANYVADRPLDDQPDQVLLWTHVTSIAPPPHCSGKIAVVGHTPQPAGAILDLGHLKCIDTACFAGGWLTALEVDAGRCWQVNRLGEVREQGAD